MHWIKHIRSPYTKDTEEPLAKESLKFLKKNAIKDKKEESGVYKTGVNSSAGGHLIHLCFLPAMIQLITNNNNFGSSVFLEANII